MTHTKQTKPIALPVQEDKIPERLKAIARWVNWRYTPKPHPNKTISWAKVPFQSSGRPAKTNSSATWSSYESVSIALALGGEDGKDFDGLGFVFDGQDDLIGIDLDDCVDQETGEFSNVAIELLEQVDGYTEISPSGTGIKIFTMANIACAYKDNSKGIEIYKDGRFFTVTGHRIIGHEDLPESLQDVDWFIEKHFGQRSARVVSNPKDAFEMFQPTLDGWDLERIEAELLQRLDPDCGYSQWLSIGMALHHQFQGGIEALTLWEAWSSNGGKFVEGECEKRWRSFSQQRPQGRGAVTLSSVIWMVRQQTLLQAQKDGLVVLNPKDYMGCASVLMEHVYTDPEGVALHYCGGQWYEFNQTHHREVDESAIRTAIWHFLNKAKRQKTDGPLLPFTPSPQNVSGTIDALRACTHLDNARPPMWLDGIAGYAPHELISLKNGLFHVPTQNLLAHTSKFFTLNSLPFEWDPTSEAPTWTQFLSDIWGDDQESIDTLQEILGYLVTPDTSMQKIFTLIGPKRSGKGTIGRVIGGLLGHENITGPTLASLTQNFGLQPLIGKLAALIADARAPSSGKQQVVERLLMMSGEDLITVDRKNRAAWVGSLTSRIVIMTNEALQLGDASGALVGRLIVLRMDRSFFGKEDRTLTQRLLAELPGIFRWALQGRARLYSRGHFVQPTAGQTMVDEMQDLNSPITEFLDDCCESNAGAQESQTVVYAAWSAWCLRNGRHPGSKGYFTRQLLAAVPDTKGSRPRVDGVRCRQYQGFRLKESARTSVSHTDLDSADDFL